MNTTYGSTGRTMQEELFPNSEGHEPMTMQRFRKLILEHYQRAGRHHLPWRGEATPWQVLLSEIMLQQTQVDRVVPKYLAFIRQFPAPQDMAAATRAEVLGLWKGLGYNRRALWLKEAAETISREHGGAVPNDQAALEGLKGIGPNTASAIRAYAFNEPVIYVETNIRAVFIHHFFPGRDAVKDAELLPMVEQSLQGQEPRTWYSALMDYGTDLKRRIRNPARRSAHHSVQSRFEGSDRQIRGRILELLLAGEMQKERLFAALGDEQERYAGILEGLMEEGFVVLEDEMVGLAE